MARQGWSSGVTPVDPHADPIGELAPVSVVLLQNGADGLPAGKGGAFQAGRFQTSADPNVFRTPGENEIGALCGWMRLGDGGLGFDRNYCCGKYCCGNVRSMLAEASDALLHRPVSAVLLVARLIWPLSMSELLILVDDVTAAVLGKS